MIHVYLIIFNNYNQIVFQANNIKSLSKVPSDSCKTIKYNFVVFL